MAEILRGKDVAAFINERSRKDVETLKEKGITPALAIVRVGEKENDIAYERNAIKRCDSIGIRTVSVVLPADIAKDDFYDRLDELNNDDEIHGILLLRPVPKHLDNEKARQYIRPEKDVDGCTDGSLAGVFTGTARGFAPCTAQAAVEILDYYGIDVTGRNTVILGRSLVVGRPLAMLLMNRNATITICHRKTVNVSEIARKAEILISAMGEIEAVTADYLSPGQTVIDVGITYSEEKQKICGDVLFEEAEPIVDKITPVPGGVGSVTTSVLVSHVVEAAKRANESRE